MSDVRRFSWIPIELVWLSKQIRPLVHLHLASFLCISIGSFLGLLNPLVLRWLIDQVIPKKQTFVLVPAMGLIFLGYEGRTALTSLGNYLMSTAALKLGLSLRMDLLRHLGKLSADYYEGNSVGSVMYPLKEPIDEISYFGSDLLPAILRSLLTIGVTVVTMFTLSPALTLLVLPLVPVFVFVRQHFRKQLCVNSNVVQTDRIAWSEFLEEHLSSAIAIQLLGQGKRQERRAFQLLARTAKSQQKLFESGVWFGIGTSLAVVLSMCAVIGYGGAKALNGTVSVGGLVAFYAFVTQLFDPLGGIAEMYSRSQKAFASIRQVQFAFALVPTIRNSGTSYSLSQETAVQIDFTNVEFGHQRQKSMLKVPALRILAGEEIAIVGENGAGKSTFAKLIARIYDVDAGSISIDGEDIRRIDLDRLRRRVCYLPREPVLFHGTLAQNLSFVKSTASRHDLAEALHCAGLSAFVETLARGLDQPVGPGGCQLSGGQRQRVALARVLLQRPQVLILDEATSCLDPPGEMNVLKNIRHVLGASTLLVVSHRFTTFSTFKRVLVISAGRVMIDGSPDKFGSSLSAYTGTPQL